MHRCIGNDDLENKRIYEESLHPEGIKKLHRQKNAIIHLKSEILQTLKKE